jgi:hypothetical protein
LEDYFHTAIFYLDGDAIVFVYDLVRKNNGVSLEWDVFKESMRQKYEKPNIRSDLLRQQLDRVRYEGPSRMMEYCATFRTIEQQLLNMNFDDKLRCFLKPLPPTGHLHIKLMDLKEKDMDVVYQSARQWAHAFEDARPARIFPGHRVKKSAHHGRKLQGKGLLVPAPTTPTSAAEAPGDDLDMINRMDGKSNQKCYSCGEYGHYANDCPRGRKDAGRSGSGGGARRD